MSIEERNRENKGLLEVFFDEECPLCRREIDLVRRWDDKKKLLFVDISSRDFDAVGYTGKSLDDLMKEIHARIVFLPSESKSRPEPNWIIGVEVFREMYSRIGFPIAVGFSRYRIVDTLLQLSYRAFARIRYHFAMKRLSKSGCRDSCKSISDVVAENKIS